MEVDDMEKQKSILIVDDTLENLEYARKAATEFPQHTFQFCSSASEALGQIRTHDALITDLFFPPEKDDTLLNKYHTYLMRVAESPSFEKVIGGYYDDNYERADKDFRDTLAVLQEGTFRVPLERLIKLYETPQRDFLS